MRIFNNHVNHLRWFLALSACIFLVTEQSVSAQTAANVPKEIELKDPAGVDITSHTLNISFQIVGFGDGTRLVQNFNLNQPNIFPFQHSTVVGVAAAQLGGIAISPHSGGGVQVGRYFGSDTDGAVIPTGIGTWHTPTIMRHANSNGTSYKRAMGSSQIVEFNDDVTGLTIGIFDDQGNRTWSPAPGVDGFKWHDGEIWAYHYAQPAGCSFRHLRAIVSNTGHAIQFKYLRETCPSNSQDGYEFEAPMSVMGIPLSETYCDFSTGNICVQEANEPNRATFTYNQPGGYVDVQSPGGVIRRLQFESRGGVWGPWISSVSYPGTNQQASYTYGAMGSCLSDEAVTSATIAGSTWTYLSSSTESEARDCIPLPQQRIDPNGGMMLGESGPSIDRGRTNIIDEQSKSWSMLAGVGLVSLPEGNYYHAQWNDRRNITSITAYPKTGSGSATIIYTASYPVDCNNPLTCNKPIWTRDALGNQSDYTYDPSHGGMLSRMLPAPSSGSGRPLTLFAYAQRYAWVMGPSGSRVQGSSAIWVPTGEVTCQTAPTSSSAVCDPAGPVLSKSFKYGAAGSADALRVKAIVVTTSEGGTQRTCFSYDRYGRRVSTTTPNADLGACP